MEFRKVLFEDPEINSLLELDVDAKADEYNYNTYASRFIAGMNARDIQVLGGQYEDRDSVLNFACKACDHTWSAMAKNAQARGCPVCKKFQINLKKSKKLWDRSKRIIKDKGGKIIKLPEIKPGEKATVDEEFLLACRRGHRFTFSHRRLYKDSWCPICNTSHGVRGTDDRESSEFVYKKRLTNPEKYARLREISEIKGSRILDPSWEEESYSLLCTACGTQADRTAKQICDNRYLCPKRCIKGHRFTLHDR